MKSKTNLEKEKAKQSGNHNLATGAKEAEEKCQSRMCYISIIHYWEQEAGTFFFWWIEHPHIKEHQTFSDSKQIAYSNIPE